MAMKIRSPKEVLKENKNHKIEIDTRGDIVEKLNKEYENQYRNNNSSININWIFILLILIIFILFK